jgi:type IV pilus assembly protein PilB
MSRIGEILVKQAVITQDQLLKSLEDQRRTGNKLIDTIISLGFSKEPQVLKALEKQYRLPGIDLHTFPIQKAAADLVRRDFCEKYGLIPIQTVGEQGLLVAFSEPGDIQVLDNLRFLTKKKIQAVVATESAIFAAIDRYMSATAAMRNFSEESLEDDEDQDVDVILNQSVGSVDGNPDDGPVIKFVNTMLAEAIRKKASDIHFEPYEKRFRVRFRIDGSMMEVQSQPTSIAPAVVSRIKIMSRLDIAEKRRPQDGRIKIQYKAGRDMDFRVSVMPTIYGEKAVLRLLDKSNLQLDMTKLGFEPEDLEVFKKGIYIPQGMLLITGPTGSGKTTTIYSALAELNKPDVNISTAEDPVEFNLEGINQLQVNSDIGVDFASALKTFLRQDPDIIMVGEIRDLETAEIAAKAASTGHLVVSTLHTNDAPQTISRLLEMGVPAYVVTSTVTLIVAQRLVGKICDVCKTPQQVPQKVLLDLGVDPQEVEEYKIFNGRGCNNCNGSGIRGRIAIFELMMMSESIKDAIFNGASSSDLRIIARKEGMRTLRRSALLKLKRGQTTIQEVLNSSVRDT